MRMKEAAQVRIQVNETITIITIDNIRKKCKA